VRAFMPGSPDSTPPSSQPNSSGLLRPGSGLPERWGSQAHGEHGVRPERPAKLLPMRPAKRHPTRIALPS